MNVGNDDELEFRIYSRAEHDAVLDMMRAFYCEDGHSFVAEVAERGLDRLEAPDAMARLWLICRPGQIAGYLCITFGFSLEIGGLDFIIDKLFVVPSARGVGVGRRALDFAEAESRKLGAERLMLEVENVNVRARKLYESRGYTAHQRELMSKPRAPGRK
jgi:GNAT superfamily N-acetyltransferase